MLERDRGGAVIRVHTCEWCGKPFYASRRHARFHSVACRVAYHRFMQHKGQPFWERANEEIGNRKQLKIFVNGVEL